MHTFFNETPDEERVFYGIKQSRIQNCTFAGAADGESALKETTNLIVKDCNFHLQSMQNRNSPCFQTSITYV